MASIEEVCDATGASISRRFGYCYVDSYGTVTPAGPAPYLDCVAAPDSPAVADARQLPWLAEAEDRAMTWIITNQLPDYLAEVQPRRAAELAKTRALVIKRLEGERDRLLYDSAIAAEKEQAGEKPKESSESLNRKAVDLDVRLRKRLELLDQQELMSTKPPRIITAALVLPIGMLEHELPASAPVHAKETKDVERRGVDLVLALRAKSSAASPPNRSSPTKVSTSCPPRPTATPTASKSKPASTAPPTSTSPTTKSSSARTPSPATASPSSRSTHADRSTTRSATSTTPSPQQNSATSKPPASAATGRRCGLRGRIRSDGRAE